MDDVKAKQQTIEKIKASTSILIAVSNSPSVDALSAALGLTLLLDKLEKHPTAIFSGTTPPAIAFLEPEKTFDDTTDSLRDFIIALDKEKADHLRLSKDGDTVKIFITPYKTHLTEADLTFSQGDFNVELVIALGVDNQDHLDGALAAHGQILHDATIITVTAADQTSTLGGIDWYDPQASSLSEMVTGLAEALKTDKNVSLLDQQIATALLTGIVAATDRFSNTHTTARALTVASQLMADGADQQLIASKLAQTYQADEVSDEPTPTKPAKKEESDDTSLSVSHDGETLEELEARVKGEDKPEEPASEPVQADKPAEPEVTPEDPASKEEISNVQSGLSGAYAPESTDEAELPSLGGTLNATTEQAAEDAQKLADEDQNKTILSHSYLDTAPSFSTPINGAADDSATPDVAAPSPTAVTNAYAPEPQPEPTLEAAPAPSPATPAELGLPMPPPLPDFSVTPPTLTPTPAVATPPLSVPQTTPVPERLGDILAPEPVAASAPVASDGPTIVPLPGEHVIQPLTNGPIVPDPAPVAPPAPNDPTQFKIPGQP